MVVLQTSKNKEMHMGSNSLQVVVLLMGVGLRRMENWEEKIQYLMLVLHRDDI